MSGKMASFWLRAAELALALLAVLVPLAFLLRAYDAASLKTTLLEAGALTLCAAYVLKGLERGRWEIPAEAAPMLLPAALLGTWIVARLLTSPDPLTALPGALQPLVGLSLFCVALLECGGADAAARFSSWLLAAAWTAGLYALAQRLGFDPLPWKGAFARPFATLGSPSALGLFAAACAPVALARLVNPERDGLMKAADGLLLALLGLAALGSSEGVVAFGEAGAICALALPAFLPSRSTMRAAVAAMLLTALATAAALSLDSAALTQDAQLQAMTRKQLWGAAAVAARSRPIVGHGPGRIALMLDERRSSALISDNGHDARPEHVPGFLPEILCELGAVGAALWAWLFGSVLLAAWQARRRFIQRAALAESAQLAGLAASLGALLAAGQWSAAVHDTAVGWLIWPLAGLCGGLSLLAARGRVSVLPLPLTAGQRRAAALAVVPVALALLSFPARWQAADVTLARASAAARRGDYAESARLAAAADVAGAPHRLEAAYVGGQSLLADGRPAEALAAFDALESRAPSFAQLQFLKGRAYARLGEWKLAAAALERQRRLDPTFVPNLELLAAAAKESGDFPSARRAALAAISLDPSNPLPKITLSQIIALEKKAQRDDDALMRARRKAPAKRPRAG